MLSRSLSLVACRPIKDTGTDTKRFAFAIRPLSVIVKASSGPRYVVGCRSSVNRDKLKPGTRVSLDMTTLTVMR